MGGYIGRGQPVSVEDGSVETADIVDGAVTAAKLAAGAAVPSQSGHSGKYLTTDGSDASWGTVAATTFPFYKADGTSDTIAITSGQFPFYKANGTADNIGVS